MISFVNKGKNTSDATATADDILSPKTAYVDNEKITGAIIPTYKSSSNNIINTLDNTISSAICDYRSDLGYYLKINSTNNTIEVYSIATNTLVLTINSNAEISTYGSEGSLKIANVKFSQNAATGNVYNIICNMYKYVQKGTHYYRVGLAVIRFDLDDPSNTNYTYFTKFDQDGNNYNSTNRTHGVGLVEKNNYVYSTIQSSSDYYQASSGATRYYYIDNTNNTITTKWSRNIGNNSGTIPYMTDDGRLITIMRGSTVAVILSVNEAHNSSTQLESFTISSSRHRPITLDDGIIYDYKYYKTSGVVHNYNSSTFPFDYNDTVIYIDGNLVRFNGSTLEVYKINKETYEITPDKAISNNGSATISYYGNNGSLNSSNYPIFNDHSMVYTTSLNNIYKCLLDGNPILAAVNIKNEVFTNTSDALSTPDKLLIGNSMYNHTGKVSGTMPNNGALSYTPTTSQQSIPAGYTSGGTIAAVTSAIDSNIKQENIKAGVTILSVSGKSSVVDTDDATAVAADILDGKTAYVNGTKITGTGSSSGSTTILDVSDDSDISVSGSTLVIDTQGGVE